MNYQLEITQTQEWINTTDKETETAREKKEFFFFFHDFFPVLLRNNWHISQYNVQHGVS